MTATGIDSWDHIVGREGRPRVSRPRPRSASARTRRSWDAPRTAVRQSDDGQTVMEGAVVAVVTNRRLILLHSTGGFRPQWSALTLGFGQLEPPVERSRPAESGCRRPAGAAI